MDYEKAYKEALEKAKKELNTCGSQDCDAARQIFRFFPELKESEDEKVRKALVELVKCNERSGYTLLNNVSTSSMLAWLEKIEKQGEQKPQRMISAEAKEAIYGKPAYAWSEEDEEHIHSLLDRLEGMCKKDATFTATRFAVNQDIDWLKSLKPQNTWKPSDEQITVLELASKYERVFTPKQIDILIDLKEQLKKLRGE